MKKLNLNFPLNEINIDDFLTKTNIPNTKKRELFLSLIPDELKLHDYKEVLYMLKNNCLCCPICGNGNKIEFISFNLGYKKMCIKGLKCNSCKNEKQNRIEETNLEKYGVKNVYQASEIKNKIKETMKEKYGVEYPKQSKEIRLKMEQTFIEKYNSKSPFGSKEVQNKIKKTMKEKYGVENSKYKHIKNYNNYNKEFIENKFNENGFLNRQKISEYFGLNYWSLPGRLKKLEIDTPLNREKIKMQKEIYNFIKSNYNGEIKFNDNTTIDGELDIYIPELNFAIELNGLLWHSYGKSKYTKFNNYNKLDKNKHLRKTELCEAKNIHLFQILDIEWNDKIKQDIWKSKILYKLNKIENKLNSRDGYFKEINNKLAKEFLDKNHLQGYVNSSIKLGFFIENELVSVFTLSKARFKNNGYELIRFASKKFTIVRGIFSKFIKYYKCNFNEPLITYGNRRWVYKENVYSNFEIINITKPNYFYFKNNKLYSRIKFQKHKLKNILEIYDNNKTELENMIENGYRIFYDCGNYKYKLL